MKKNKDKRMASLDGAKRYTWVKVVLVVLILAIAVIFVQYIVNLFSIIRYGISVSVYDLNPNGAVAGTSCFHDCYVEDGYVYYRCDVVVKNHTSHTVQAQIAGMFCMDYLWGYIDTPFLEGLDSEQEDFVLSIDPHETLLLKGMYFRGIQGNNADGCIKYDRSLPLIYFEPV